MAVGRSPAATANNPCARFNCWASTGAATTASSDRRSFGDNFSSMPDLLVRGRAVSLKSRFVQRLLRSYLIA
jgi:hypothetical protein